ncbi:uncharacterized protein LOC128128087 [Lactuca sativa]|uniref:uncharacterized protein LOC128128087 n=1 Tax=Lactuca sativa TaxID=4236 RepID=UPI0022AEC896|nr:uncharacterized protein LOC128128087 [Lactuca sativa]
MSMRKYESGASKRKRKMQEETFIDKQKGSFLKYLTTNKNVDNEQQQTNVDNEQEQDNVDNNNHEPTNIESDNEPINIDNDNEKTNIEIDNEQTNIENDNEQTNIEIDNEHTNSENDNEQSNIEIDNEQTNNENDNTPLNIYDPSRWNNISTNLRDLIVKKCPIKIYDFKFPKDQHLRSFSTSLYMQKIPNGEKYERTCKNLQSSDMCIDDAIDQLNGLLCFFKEYRENIFEEALDYAKELALEMNVKPEFRKKRIIQRNRRYDENVANETIKTPV